MRHPSLLRSAVAAVALSLVASLAAFADTVVPDADTIAPGAQSSFDLGTVAPGAIVNVPIDFTLACAGLQHLDVGQSASITIDAASIPPGGDLTMDPVVVGPVPAGWPADAEACSGTEAPLTGSGTVVVTAPLIEDAYEIPVIFARAATPDGNNDESAFSGMTAATYMFTVVANTPPALNLPADIIVDGDTSLGGWTADWVVTATDAEDDPDPIPTCVPAVGEVIPFGTTTVNCTVTDSGDLDAMGSFDVTVNEPAPSVLGAPEAVFGPPIKDGELVGHAGRTIPMKVRLLLGDVSIGEGSLVLVVTSCDGGDPVAELEMDWRAGSQRWFGHLRTKGWEPGCYDVRAMYDGVDVGGATLTLTGKGAGGSELNQKVKAPKGDDATEASKKDKDKP